MADLTNIEKARRLYLTRWQALKNERQSWFEHYRELSGYFMPRTGRFLLTNRNRGEKRQNLIYDNTPARALRVLAAGMMSGMSSPARPWFKLRTADPDLNQSRNVKMWLSQAETLELDILAKSNTYRSLHRLYIEEGLYGTGAAYVLPDYHDVVRHYTLTAGEYAISTDARGMVSTIYREFEMTVSQIVSKFVLQPDGTLNWSNVSATIQNLYERGVGLDSWIPVLHIVEPRYDRDNSSLLSINAPWKSIYLERDTTEAKVLRESGFQEFPGVAPRWDVGGGDIYGNSPGMESLGDVKQLMFDQKRKAQAIDYQVRPPLRLPSSLKGQQESTLPGGVAYVDSADPAIGTLFDVNLNIEGVLNDIEDIRQRIDASFYVDMFLMLTQQSGDITAREVAEKHEEKLLMLGPVLERQHNELLAPVVKMTFMHMLKAGLLPPPPPEMQGQMINIQFVSVLAQAQRAVATSAMDQFTSALGVVAQVKADVLDKFDADEWAQIYADDLGVDPRLIVPDKQVAVIRAQRAKAQIAQQQAQQQQNPPAASQTGPADDINNFTGYALPRGPNQ